MGVRETVANESLMETVQRLYHTDREQAMSLVWRYWLDKLMPLRYRQVNIMKLEPSEKSRLPMKQQEWFYNEVREHLDDGFMISGPVGTSKTTVALGYYRFWLGQEIRRIAEEHPEHERAFTCRTFDRHMRHFAVWRQDAKTLLMEHHDFAINRPNMTADGTVLSGAPDPLVNADKIRRFARGGVIPRLVLEEVDKVQLTKARRDTLFEIIDVLNAELGKLFINTNLRLDEFENQFGAQFVRRLKQSCRVIDLYARMEEK
jgi:hypothetical protein